MRYDARGSRLFECSIALSHKQSENEKHPARTHALPESAGMNGQLNEHPLVELIHEISVANLSGALRLAHERVKTVLYFEKGEIVYAASNLRAHRLSECALRWGIVSEAQLASVQERETDKKFASALVTSGALNTETLNELLERQVATVLRPALLWTEGEWNFNASVRLTEDMRVQIETRALLLEAARRLPQDFVAARFTDEEENLSPTQIAASTSASFTPSQIVASAAGLKPAEAFVLSRVDAPLRLGELVSISGINDKETLHIIYALALGGFLERSKWVKVFSEEEIKKALAQKKADAKTAVTPPPVATMTAKKGGVDNSPNAHSDLNAELDLDGLFARLNNGQDYYALMGLKRTATSDEIKQAYHALARRFHPDKYLKNSSQELHARIEKAFLQIAQAYETLRNKQLRATYDYRLEIQKGAPDASGSIATARNSSGANASQTVKASVPQAKNFDSNQPSSTAAPRLAEEKYRQGMAALQQNNPAQAAGFLADAARLAPNEARYHAQYGRALAGNGQLRQAETELQAAIALDGATVSFRVMLAEVYRDIGLLRRAHGELERALAIDPQHKAAQQLLKNLPRK